MSFLRPLLAGGLVAVFAQAKASGVSPYLPLNMSPEIERQIERLLILGDRPVLTRPIPAATVLDAMPVACAKDEILCRRVRRYLNRYLGTTGLGHGSIEVAASNGSIGAANQHGMSTDAAWRVSGEVYWQPSPYGILSLGGTAYDGDSSPAGSIVSLGFDFAQLDVGYRDRWLSPFTESAMLLSTNAKMLPSVTLSNYEPLTRLGLQYQVFMAEMEHSDRIRYQDVRSTSGTPRLAGLQLGIAPVPGWSLAVNRIMQYGGGKRGGRSLRDFWNALVDPQGYDAISLDVTYDESFGNQAAAVTSRFIFPGRTPFSVYFEYAGEDRAWEGNYRLGNSALSIGISFPRLWERFDLTYEASEWQNSWYIHSIYGDGLMVDRRVLGHWGADMRNKLDAQAVGAQAHVLRLGWEPEFGGLIQLRARTLANEKYTPTSYERAYDLAASYSRALGGYTVGGEVSAGRDVYGDSFSRLSGFFRFGDEWSFAGASSSDSTGEETSGAELFVDAGLNVNRVRVIIDAIDVADGYDTDTDVAPHIGVGARRAVSKRQDLGVRVEADTIQSELMLSVRALDYRFRWNDTFAVSAFLGAARYDVATPAYGYYGGFGMQLRNILPRVDLGIDARFADKVARDKLLPGEPKQFRPDAFYDIYSVSSYLSYRW